MVEKLQLVRKDLPGLYRSASADSQKGQKQYTRGISVELGLLVLATIAGFSTIHVATFDVAGFIAALIFMISIIVQKNRRDKRPERIWYNGRAAAESIKSQAWCFAVGGELYRKDVMSNADATTSFVNILKAYQDHLHPHYVIPPTLEDAITDQMIIVRNASLVQRREVYKNDRIINQEEWYSRNTTLNKKRASFWNSFLIGIELLGTLAAVGKATGLIKFDILGLAAVIAVVAVSWLQLKQYESLAQSYTIAADELNLIRSQIGHQLTEENWGDFVQNAEEAISREHKLWRDTRSGFAG